MYGRNTSGNVVRDGHYRVRITATSPGQEVRKSRGVVVDRTLGGGNSVLPDQALMLEARATIPAGEGFRVVVGEPQTGWTDLTATYAETFARYFLLPRRPSPDAPWVLCYACDPARHPGFETVWTGSDGISLLRRSES